MSSGVYCWSIVPANNATADSAINLRDNQAPSTVKLDLRALMAQIAKDKADTNGSITTGGTSTAYTITTNTDISGETSVPDGFEVAATLHADNGAAPTLAVDGHTAAPITFELGFAPAAGSLRSTSIQRFVWKPADSQWRLVGSTARDNTATGAEVNYWGATLPGGYVWANGTTIGNASSNASGRANADCSALFSKLWMALANTEAAIYDSAGSTTTRGLDAASDFAANKAISLPDRRDRLAVGKGTMGGATAAGRILNTSPVSLDTSTLGKAAGADRETLITSQIPAHNHNVTDPGHTHTFSRYNQNVTAYTNAPGGVRADGSSDSPSTGSSTTGISIQNAGGGGAHNNLPPVIVCNVIIKL